MNKYEGIFPRIDSNTIKIEIKNLENGIYRIQFLKNKKPVKELILNIR